MEIINKKLLPFIFEIPIHNYDIRKGSKIKEN
jgi:hypothetical protein